MMALGKMRVHPGDAASAAFADVIAGKVVAPCTITDIGNEVLLSLNGRLCRHLTIEEADAAIEQLQAARDRAARHLDGEHVSS